MDKDLKIEREAELDPYSVNAKSSVSISKNSKGVNWTIKVVTGEEKLIVGLMQEAIKCHKKIQTELNINTGG